MTQVHAFCDDLLADHDAVALAERVRRGEIAAAELLEAVIARIERVNPQLNAVAFADYERARAQSGNSGAGVFAGIPTFIKDNTDVAGMPTGHGSRAVARTPAAADGAFTRQLLSLGVRVLGKTTLPEFGFNCTTEYQNLPPTRNPWNPAYSSGGSSGGAAALVAAGAVPIAHGNDGGGSIRIPAACCGLVGLKPTRGRLVKSELARFLPVQIVTDGVLTRTVRDTAVFYAHAERYWKNGCLPPIGLVEGPAARRCKIGLVIDSITEVPTCAETRQVVEQTANLLDDLGHTIQPIAPAASRSLLRAFPDYWGFLGAMACRFGHRRFGKGFDRRRVDRFTQGLADSFRHRGWFLPLSLYRLRRTWQLHARKMQHYDLVLSPVVAHVTPKLGHLSPEHPFSEVFQRMMNYASFTPMNNINGSPAISLPLGISSQGLPIGLQFSAAHGDERRLLEIAYELEQVQPWPRIDRADPT